jgi:Pyridoxal-dependent decarboxylase conserved domain
VVTTQSAYNLDLSPDSRPAYEIFSNLEQLILYSESPESDDEEFFMPILDGTLLLSFYYIIVTKNFFPNFLDVSHLAIVSQSVLSYIKNISPGTRLMRISNNIYKQVSSWITSLFFTDALSEFLPTNTDCLSKALRLALTLKFENYIKDGLKNVKNCSIYIVNTNPYLPDLKFSVHLIGLPQSSIKIIPVVEGTEMFDFKELEKQIANDSSTDIVPLFLFADLGSSFTGGVNGTLKELCDISQKYGAWLHVSGPLVASFALTQSQSEFTKGISSMTMDFESWLGLPNIPTVLLHKRFSALQQGIFEIESDMRKLDSFPVWTVIQNLGRDKIVDTFAKAFQSCNILNDMVAKTKGFKIISNQPVPHEEKEAFSLDSFTSVVLFQFDGSGVHELTEETKDQKLIEKINYSSYFDRLNSWLGQTLERDFPQVQLTLMDHSIYGTCIRYSPFELNTGEKVIFFLNS